MSESSILPAEKKEKNRERERKTTPNPNVITTDVLNNSIHA